MNHDEEKFQGTDLGKHYCAVCGILYPKEEECPSCNPKTLYYVEIGVPDGPDSIEFQACECNDCAAGFWDKDEAVGHAKRVVRFDGVVRVIDEEGTEVWANM